MENEYLGHHFVEGFRSGVDAALRLAKSESASRQVIKLIESLLNSLNGRDMDRGKRDAWVSKLIERAKVS